MPFFSSPDPQLNITKVEFKTNGSFSGATDSRGPRKYDDMEVTFLVDDYTTFKQYFLDPMEFISADLETADWMGKTLERPVSEHYEPGTEDATGTGMDTFEIELKSKYFYSNLILVSPLESSLIKGTINFLSEEYEELASSSGVNEKTLPNLYASSLLENAHFSDDLDDDFDNTFPFIDINAAGTLFKLENKEEYISKYVDAYDTADIDLIDTENNNIMFTSGDGQEVYNLGNTNAGNLPYSLDLEFNKGAFPQVASGFYSADTGMEWGTLPLYAYEILEAAPRDLAWDTMLLSKKELLFTPQALNLKDPLLLEKPSHVTLPNATYTAGAGVSPGIVPCAKNRYVKYGINDSISLVNDDGTGTHDQSFPGIPFIELNQHVASVYDASTTVPETNAVFMTYPDNASYQVAVKETELYGQRASMPLNDSHEESHDAATREFLSYKEIYTNDDWATAEIYCYKIEKFGPTSGDTPLQTFWIPNIETEMVRYYDTQIKHNTLYTYKVSAIVFSYGTKYRFDLITEDCTMAMVYTTANCVIGGTQIQTEAGEISIEDVIIGSRVLSYNFDTNEMGYFEVLATFSNTADKWCRIKTASGHELSCSLDHPVMSKSVDKLELKASDASPGDHIWVFKNGELVDDIIASIEIFENPTQVYNLTVKDVNTYISDGILSHNFTLVNDYEIKVRMKVIAEASTNVYEIPGLAIFQGKTTSQPPMFPEVNLVPYRNVDNKILISLNKGLGRVVNNSAADYKVLDEALERSYADSLSEAAALEGVEAKDLEIDYSLETPVKGYVVYKIKDRAPLSYSDFDGKVSKILTNNGYSDAMEMVDDIEFNVDYYYAFKTFDAFGSYSYPTSVYKLRMVKDSNSVYPLIGIHQMGPVENRETTKTFKKLINIKPNIAQSAINYAESDIAAKNIRLGNLEEGLFGQKFKIRIRSKQTGKEIDLNIDFNNTVIDKTI